MVATHHDNDFIRNLKLNSAREHVWTLACIVDDIPCSGKYQKLNLEERESRKDDRQHHEETSSEQKEWKVVNLQIASLGMHFLVHVFILFKHFLF